MSLSQPQPVDTETPIVPEEDFSDYESQCDGTETFSLASSINEYFEANGRRYYTYFGPDKNPMPSDELETNRLDLAHECTLGIMRNRLHLAPVQDVQRALDLGTGTGVWAIQFAEENPQAVVYGIDISPIQPNWVPPNCKLEIEDFERTPWVYSAPFDFIHARTIAQSVNNWPRLLAEALQYLTPGKGWLEMGEYAMDFKSDDDSVPADWPPKVVWDLLREGMLRKGRKFPTGENMKRMLQDAGFVDVELKTLKLPQGPWPKNRELKQIGGICMGTAETGYEAYAYHTLTTALEMPEEEAKRLCAEAREAHLRDAQRKVHAYMEYYVVYGRKPYPHEA